MAGGVHHLMENAKHKNQCAILLIIYCVTSLIGAKRSRMNGFKTPAKSRALGYLRKSREQFLGILFSLRHSKVFRRVKIDVDYIAFGIFGKFIAIRHAKVRSGALRHEPHP